MAKINFVVGPFHPTKFSGGILCLLQYARGLLARNHEVRLVPMLPSPFPKWSQLGPQQVLSTSYSQRLKMLLPSLKKTFRYVFQKNTDELKKSLGELSTHLQLIEPRIAPYALRSALSIEYVKRVIPEADVTLATSYETALPVALYGTGKRFYFMQHYEPFFKNESSNPYLAEQEAQLSYALNLEKIANSSWLQKKIQTIYPEKKVAVCLNAIDHSIYQGEPKIASSDQKEIRIISYGGRNATWKGFREMAEAVKKARASLTHRKIHWLVYGDALLPPDNPIASYQSLGFLNPPQLAQAYRSADLLLSASWYESFPLFPLEAMACGLPVITTQAGTEDYAFPGNTAEIVEAQQVESIAEGLIHLIEDVEYRNKLAKQGHAESKKLTWEKSVDRLEKLLIEF